MKQQLFDAVALVFKHEEDFIKTFEDDINYDADGVEGFWMSGTNCLVRVYDNQFPFSYKTVFIQTEDFLEWLGGKS